MKSWHPIEIFYVLVTLASVFAILAGTIISFLPKFCEQNSTIKTRWQIFFSVLSISTLSCMAYGFFVEPYNLEVTHIVLKSNKLKKAQFRIVQFSDTHCDETPRVEKKLVAKLQELKPDAIIFCGDACNSREGLNNFKDIMRASEKVAPTFFAKGDWDFSFHPALDYLTGTQATFLFNKAFNIYKDNEAMWIAGTSTGSAGLIPEIFSKIPEKDFCIFAYHEPYPDVLPVTKKVDLFLTGHTHGGQIVFPLIGALITRSKYGYQYVSGMYDVNGTKMYVNRGIGMEGHFPRARFLSVPEITCFDIVPAD